MEKKIEIYASKIKVILLCMLSLGFVFMGFFIIHLYKMNEVSDFANFIGWCAVLFFGFGVVIFIIKLFSNKPELVISSEGIIYTKFQIKKETIEWKDIENICELSIEGTKLVGLVKKTNKKDIITMNGYNPNIIYFSSSTLKNYNYEKLKSVIEETFLEYQKGTNINE